MLQEDFLIVIREREEPECYYTAAQVRNYIHFHHTFLIHPVFFFIRQIPKLVKEISANKKQPDGKVRT